MRYLIGILLMFLATTIMASTKVIATLGQTESSAPFIAELMQKKVQARSEQMQVPASYKANYVVHTKELTPGVVTSRKVELKDLTQPIYIVGDDELSKNWLKKYKTRLEAVKAIGFIVNVINNESYLNFSKELDVNPTPINGRALAERFDIKHYPVLISQHLIEQ